MDVVLVIGSAEKLDLATRYAAAAIHPSIGVHCCELRVAATDAATIRPMAIVMSADAYAFDPAELGALARDVGAPLVLVDAERLGARGVFDAVRARLEEIFASRRLITS